MSEAQGERESEQGAHAQPAAEGETVAQPTPGRPHRFRWFSLCIAASAGVMILVLLQQLGLDLPLSFGGTLLLAALAGLALPALVRIALGYRWLEKGLRPAYFWFGTCLFEILILTLILVI